MQVTEISSAGLKREFKVVIDASDIDARIEDRLEQLRMTVRMPGFRPGKVPVSLLRKKYGDSLRGEVLEQAVNQSSNQALAEQGVRPALQPKIEVTRFEEGEGLEYTMAVEAMPDIVPGDLDDVKLTNETAAVTDAEIESAIERLAARDKNYVPVTEDRPAGKGDALLIDFVGKIDGAPFEGGSATDHTLELGSSSFVEGFEDQLIGKRAGDSVEVKVTFPNEYMSEALSGKDAVFEVEIKEIQTVEPVPVDDAFSQGLGFENLEGLREAMREQTERDHTVFSRAKLKRRLLDELARRYDFPVPAGMVDLEFDAIWQRVSEDREKNRLDEDDVGREEEELRAEYRAIAERRVRLGLLLSEIGRLNSIDVDPERVNRVVMERAQSFPGQEAKVVEFYRSNPQALAELRAPLFEEKVVDYIIDKATITDKLVSLDELMRDPEDLDKSKGAKPAKKKAAAKSAKKSVSESPKKKTAKKKPAGKPKKASE
jgi:trigger factor